MPWGPPEPKRVRIYRVAGPLTALRPPGCPASAELVEWKEEGGVVLLKMRHESFRHVPEGEAIPTVEAP